MIVSGAASCDGRLGRARSSRRRMWSRESRRLKDQACDGSGRRRCSPLEIVAPATDQLHSINDWGARDARFEERPDPAQVLQ